MISNITLIGAGNLATQLGLCLKEKKIKINQVYSKSLISAKTLSKKLNCDFTNQINKIEIIDLGIICIKDDLISSISKKLPDKPVVHTSGSTQMSIIKKFVKHGVIYPIQTFNKNQKVKFNKIPICIEANNKNFYNDLRKLCNKISSKVVKINSEERLKIHIASVIVNNFTNHLIGRAQEMLKKNNLSFELLKPIINETFRKINLEEAKKIQTGPAIRKDIKTINKHLRKLQGLDRKIYKLISKQIISNN